MVTLLRLAERLVECRTGTALRNHQYVRVVVVALLALTAACEAGPQAEPTPDAQPGLTLSLPAPPPRYPQLSDLPDRPRDLPTADQLAERRRRLEADRDAAKGLDSTRPPVAPVPAPLPELTHTMEETPIERPSTGLVRDARAGVSVQVATVYFPMDSNDLDQQMIDVLSQVAREQQAIGGAIRVIGHGGATGSEDLARRQVAVIGQTLVRMGVPPTRIDTDLAERGAIADAGDHGRAVIYLDY